MNKIFLLKSYMNIIIYYLLLINYMIILFFANLNVIKMIHIDKKE